VVGQFITSQRMSAGIDPHAVPCLLGRDRRSGNSRAALCHEINNPRSTAWW
jgi:hypothetical protein